MNVNGVKKFLYNLFHILFIVTFALILFIIFLFYKSTMGKVSMIILSILFFVLIIGLYTLIIKSKIIKEKNEKKLLILIFLIFMIFQIFVGIQLRVKPSWDFGSVYNEAVHLTKTNSWIVTNEAYFLMYPNNQFCLLTLTFIYKIFNFFNIQHYVIVGILTNIIFVDVSLIILYICMKKIWNFNIAFFGLILSFFCCGYITYLPIFYTDTFPLPFTNCMLLLYILIIKEKNIKKSLIYMILLAISCMIGFEYKATVVIILVAVILHFLFLFPIKKSLLCLIVVCASFVGSMKLYSGLMESSSFLDNTQYDRYNFPYTHWIMMGLKTPGGYNPDDYYYTKSFKTKEEKTTANLAVIQDRIEKMDSLDFVDHLVKKINFTWNDGTYFSSELLSRKPVIQGFCRELFSEGGQFNFMFKYYANGMHYSILVLMIFSALNGLSKMRKYNQMDFISCIRLAVYGLFVFLLLWETKSKYLVNFLPLMYLVAIDGVNYIHQYMKGERNNDKIGDCSTML